MKYRGIFEYEYPTEHKPPVSIDVHLHGDCVKGKIIEWEYRPLEQEPTTKNDLGVDCISRAQAQTEIEMNASRYTIAKERGGMGQVEWSDQLIKVSDAVDIIRALPSVTPQEPQTFKWCTDCKEYDQEKHCCHRYSKVIRDTVEEMKQESKTGQRSFSLESLDEDAKETVIHLVECYEDECFTKDERVMLAGIALKARIRFQLNKYLERD